MNDFDFMEDIDDWSGAKDSFENPAEPCCLYLTVTDDGQYAIKTRWVVTEPDDVSKGYNLKARLCMHGDRENDKDSVMADSPTAYKDTLKLALAVAANE